MCSSDLSRAGARDAEGRGLGVNTDARDTQCGEIQTHGE